MKNDANDVNGGLCCGGCEFMRMYDYVKRTYWCDHEGRDNDMGKLGVDALPKTVPVWCPLKNNENK